MSDEIQLPEVIDMKAFEKIRADFLVRAYMKVAARYEEKVIALIALKDDLNDVTTGSEDSKMLLADIEAKRKEVENELKTLNRCTARLRLLAPERAPLTLATDDLYSPKEAAPKS